MVLLPHLECLTSPASVSNNPEKQSLFPPAAPGRGKHPLIVGGSMFFILHFMLIIAQAMARGAVEQVARVFSGALVGLVFDVFIRVPRSCQSPSLWNGCYIEHDGLWLFYILTLLDRLASGYIPRSPSLGKGQPPCAGIPGKQPINIPYYKWVLNFSCWQMRVMLLNDRYLKLLINPRNLLREFLMLILKTRSRAATSVLIFYRDTIKDSMIMVDKTTVYVSWK